MRKMNRRERQSQLKTTIEGITPGPYPTNRCWQSKSFKVLVFSELSEDGVPLFRKNASAFIFIETFSRACFVQLNVEAFHVV